MVVSFISMVASVELAGTWLLVLRFWSWPVRLVPSVVYYPLCMGTMGLCSLLNASCIYNDHTSCISLCGTI